MPVAILPAAGRSRRMGRPKLLLPFGDTTVVGATVRALQEGGAGTVVLVVAPGDGALAAWGRDQGLTVATNPDPARGMLSSIREGIAAAGAALAGQVLLVSPADLPALSGATVRALLEAMAARGAPLAVPAYRGRRGHPLALSPALVPEIATLDLNQGLRQLVQRHLADLLVMEVDDTGTVHDVDTPEAYERLRADGARGGGALDP